MSFKESIVLADATLRAASSLGISRQTLSSIIGRDRSRLRQGIPVESKSAELALILVRCYRALYVLFDGDETAMRHWLNTLNSGTGGLPIDQLQHIEGLVSVLHYLETMHDEP